MLSKRLKIAIPDARNVQVRLRIIDIPVVLACRIVSVVQPTTNVQSPFGISHMAPYEMDPVEVQKYCIGRFSRIFLKYT